MIKRLQSGSSMIWLTTLLCGTLAITNSASASHGAFPISVINLDKDVARWQGVNKELSKGGVPAEAVERLSAVHGSKLTPQQIRENTTFLARLFATPGMIGCYLSHRTFWEKVLARPEPWALVLEDDVKLVPDFCAKVGAAVAELDECAETKGSWDVLLVGALGCVNPTGQYGLNRINAFVGGGGRRARQVTASVHVPRRPFGTHAYVLSRRGAAKLLERASLAAYHIDAVAWGMPALRLFSAHPMLAYQAFEAPSTIGAVTAGPEASWLSHAVVDAYTGVTFAWAFNEPVIKLPGQHGLTLTIGRSLVLALLGLLGGTAAVLLDSKQKAPGAHLSRAGAFLLSVLALVVATFVLLRLMVQPHPKPSLAQAAVDTAMMAAVALAAEHKATGIDSGFQPGYAAIAPPPVVPSDSSPPLVAAS